ncbi:MFS transporter [Salinithrix halophila]|uniref:MFS transporter n=1 Tax=Salinithrix halophila TaxID=1485204 RepID=A0ABV8JDP9_9BACL
MRFPEVFKNKNYVKVLIAMSISKLGDSFFLIALPLLVYDLTKSPGLMALAFVLEVAPQVLFSLLGGALADQISKKKIMILGDMVSALLIVSIPLAYHFQFLEIWMIYVVIFCLASVSAFYHPSFESVVPEVLQDKNLVQGNSLFKLSETLTTFAGPSIAGFLIAMMGVAHVLYIDSVSFFLSGICISFVKLKAIEKRTKMPSIIKPIKEGLRYVFKTKVILTGTFLIFLINVGYGAVEALFMFYLKDYLRLQATDIGIIFSCQTIGSLIAVYLANKLNSYSRGRIIIFAGVMIGLGQVLLVASQSFIIGLVICRMIILGSVTLLAINWFTLRQEIVPRNLLGRVVSSTRMVAFLALPISGSIAGSLAEFTSVLTIFLTAGILVVIFSLLGLKSVLNTYEKITQPDATQALAEKG